jgi:hypothetical protein
MDLDHLRKELRNPESDGGEWRVVEQAWHVMGLPPARYRGSSLTDGLV